MANRSLDAMLSKKSLLLIPRTQRWVAGFAVGLVVVTCGCFNSATTRLPQSRPWLPDQENAAYEQQYPFADPDIGPSTESNPRGYDRPRSSSRRAAEQRVFQGFPACPAAIPTGPGASSPHDAIHCNTRQPMGAQLRVGGVVGRGGRRHRCWETGGMAFRKGGARWFSGGRWLGLRGGR